MESVSGDSVAMTRISTLPFTELAARVMHQLRYHSVHDIGEAVWQAATTATVDGMLIRGDGIVAGTVQVISPRLPLPLRTKIRETKEGQCCSGSRFPKPNFHQHCAHEKLMY